MSEPNEKILKRAALSEEEAAQVTGGTSEEEVYCLICEKTHARGICPPPSFLDDSIGSGTGLSEETEETDDRYLSNFS